MPYGLSNVRRHKRSDRDTSWLVRSQKPRCFCTEDDDELCGLFCRPKQSDSEIVTHWGIIGLWGQRGETRQPKMLLVWSNVGQLLNCIGKDRFLMFPSSISVLGRSKVTWGQQSAVNSISRLIVHVIHLSKMHHNGAPQTAAQQRTKYPQAASLSAVIVPGDLQVSATPTYCSQSTSPLPFPSNLVLYIQWGEILFACYLVCF